MNEVELKFEPANIAGLVPIGSYLIDAAKRLGVKIETECDRQGKCDSCACLIKKGGDLLSKPTKLELEHLSELRRNNGERLSCQSKLEKYGEIIAMPTAVKEQPKPTLFEQFKKEFAELPLQEKISQILELESLTLSDSFSAVLNLPYTIGEKVRDMMAEVGMKMEEEAKKAKTPDEHKTEPKVEPKAEEKPKTAKKPAGKKPAVRKKAKPDDTSEKP